MTPLIKNAGIHAHFDFLHQRFCILFSLIHHAFHDGHAMAFGLFSVFHVVMFKTPNIIQRIMQSLYEVIVYVFHKKIKEY